MSKFTIPFGSIGLPPGVKENPRVDFEINEFTRLIEVSGMRLAWSRAAVCPCNPVNDQTQQKDPLCPLCKGGGWLYFGPKDYSPPLAAGSAFDSVQQLLIEKDGAAVIRGIMTSLANTQSGYDRLGNWVWGTANLTVRPENKLGYYDRLIHLDSEINFSEVIEMPNTGAIMKPRYPIRGMNLIRSLDKIYTEDVDWTLQDGSILWLQGKVPAAGTRIGVHYLCHPQWIVIEQPKVLREMGKHFKVRKPVTPVGDPQALPIQVVVKLEYLV